MSGSGLTRLNWIGTNHLTFKMRRRQRGRTLFGGNQAGVARRPLSFSPLPAKIHAEYHVLSS